MKAKIRLKIELWEISSEFKDRFFSQIKGANNEIMWSSEGLRSPASCRKSVMRLIEMIGFDEQHRRDCEEVGIEPDKGILVNDLLPGKKLNKRY